MRKTLLFLLLFVAPTALFSLRTDVRLFTVDGTYYNSRTVRTAPHTRYIVVDFFSSVCAPCKQSLPLLNELTVRLHKRGLRAVVVAQPAGFDSEQEEKQALAKIVKQYSLSIPVVFDLWQVAGKKYGVETGHGYSVPQYFIIDRNGKIVFHTDHFEQLKKKVEQLFREKPVRHK